MRRPALVLVPCALAALVSAAPAFHQGRDFSQVEVEVHPVAGAVSCLTGAGGNIGVSAGEDGILLIDDQFAGLAPKIEAALDEISPKDPVFLINTHHHGDHTGGNEHFGKQATIFAHANVRGRLVRGESPEGAFPVVTYEDGVSIHFNGEEVRVFHVPNAHTDGDSVVWFTGSNVVHMGDLYFQAAYPYIDLSSGGNALGLVEGLERVIAGLPADVRVIPGHGKVTGLDGLREYAGMIAEIVERVRAALEQGDDVDAMVEGGVTADYDERWGGSSFVPPRRFVESIVGSLAAAGSPR